MNARAYFTFLFLFIGTVATAQKTLADEGSGSFQAIRATGTGKILAIEHALSDSDVDPSVHTIQTRSVDFILQADKYLQQISETYPEIGIQNIEEQLTPLGQEHNELGFYKVTYEQRYHDVPVLGAAVTLQLNEDKSFRSFHGRFMEEIELDIHPKVRRGKARLIAKLSQWNEPLYVRYRRYIRKYVSTICEKSFRRIRRAKRSSCYRKYYRMTRKVIRSFFRSNAELIIYSKHFLNGRDQASDAQLAWKVEVHNRSGYTKDTYIIDATTGALLDHDDGVRGIHRKVYDCALTSDVCFVDLTLSYQLPDSSIFSYTHGRSEGKPARGALPLVGDYYNSTDVDDFYNAITPLHNFFETKLTPEGYASTGDFLWDDVIIKTHFDNNIQGEEICENRPSVSGPGYISLCHAAEADHHDLLAHEYAHFITNNIAKFGSTISLHHEGESGALAEAFSDFIGEAYERQKKGTNDWMANSAGTYAFRRNMKNPTQSFDNTNSEYAGMAYPDKYSSSNFYCGDLDDGGVHINTGVINKATYLMTEGGDFNGCRVQGIGMEKVRRIWYWTVKNYFNTESMTFSMAAVSLIRACNDYAAYQDNPYGITANDCRHVEDAIYAVEMNLGGGCGTIPTPPATPLCSDPIEETNVIPGDYDRDGDVDECDYKQWRSQYGSTPSEPGEGADGNSDGVIDAADYALWRKHLGTGVKEVIPGDYDRNGIVDEDDYTVWRSQYGSTPCAKGDGADGNKDGVIDAADYALWRKNLGRTSL